MKKKFMHANEPLKKFMLRQKKFIQGIVFFFFKRAVSSTTKFASLNFCTQLCCKSVKNGRTRIAVGLMSVTATSYTK